MHSFYSKVEYAIELQVKYSQLFSLKAETLC